MSGIDFRSARGPAALFGHDDASRHRAAVEAARAIVHASRLPLSDRRSPAPTPEPAGAWPARPAGPPSRAGWGRWTDAAVVITAVLALLLVATVSIACRVPTEGAIWL